jgi:hypothetical protein
LHARADLTGWDPPAILAGSLRNPTRRRDIETRTVDHETVILDVARNRVHRLNPSASYIWECCDGQRSVPEIAVELAGAHALSVDQVLSDVQDTIAEFERLELLADDVQA